MPKPVRTARVNIKVTAETDKTVKDLAELLSTEDTKWTPTDIYEAGVACLARSALVRNARLDKAASARKIETGGE